MNSTYSLNIEIPFTDPKFYKILTETKDWASDEDILDFIKGYIQSKPSLATIHLTHTQEVISI